MKEEKNHQHRVILVSGANKGIGFELCRQFAQKGLSVILTARDSDRGNAAVNRLKKESLTTIFCPLDVSDDSSVDQCFQFVKEKFGRLDYLVNNAGVLFDSMSNPQNHGSASILKTNLDVIRKSIEINTFGAIRMAQHFAPLMLNNKFGRIINISSGMAQLSEMNGGWPGYRISKVALNAVTRMLADELSSTPITVVSVCPGWVKTDMGGPQAEIPVQEAAEHIVRTMLEFNNTGEFVRFNKQIDW